MKTQRFGIVGCPSDIGGITSGSSRGPAALRQAGLVPALQSLGHDVIDTGDITPGNSGDVSFSAEEKTTLETNAVYGCCRALSNATEQILQDGRIPFVLGGDHSLSIGSVSGVSNYYSAKGKKIGLIWADTHPDMNTPATSPSRKIFGMPVAFLTGLVPGAFSALSKRAPAIDLENVAFIGLRDVDPGERDLIRKHGITAYSMKEIDIEGLAVIVKKAIAAASKNTEGFVLSFDLDVCDPQIVPGTGTPFRGGLTFRETHLLLELIAESEKLLGFELVELNPVLDQNGKTVEHALSFAESVAGKSIL